MERLLETKHLRKYYERGNQIKAVDDVSLSICQGKSMGLIGESGSGKTTFGKLAAGLESVTSGTVTFMGQEIQNMKEREFRPYRKDLQMIFQSSGGVFDPSYTIGESIGEVLNNYKNLSKTETEEAIVEVLKKVGLEANFRNRYVNQLSGGQCQRANIARALVLHPRLVICDEPVSSLDYSIRKQILNLLKEIQEEFKVTYLLITHDLSNIPYVCDAVAIMYQGKIVEQMDFAKDIEKKAVHPYTRLLFQSIPAADPFKRKINADTGEKIYLDTLNREGCSFQNRCKECKKKCKEQAPVLQEISKGHWTACHLYQKQ